LATSRQAELPDIYQVEYIVLTQLQADALVPSDDKLAAAARAFVKTASPADILRAHRSGAPVALGCCWVRHRSASLAALTLRCQHTPQYGGISRSANNS